MPDVSGLVTEHLLSISPYEIEIPDLGNVRLRVTGPNMVEVNALNTLLWEGLLYSLHASFGKQGETWYPISGVVLTGAGAYGKAPSKIQTPVITQIAAAVNAHMAQHPDIFTDFNIQRVKERLFIAKNRLNSSQYDVRRFQRDLEQEEEWKRSRLRDAQENEKTATAEVISLERELEDLTGTPPTMVVPALSSPVEPTPD